MKTLSRYIKEELDENIYWLLNKWFERDEESENTFIELVAKCGSKTISVDEIKNTIKNTELEKNLKQFINFIDGDVHDSDKDYYYVLKKIVETVSANKSTENKYIKKS